MYLRCAAHVTVQVIKKLLCMKLDIGHQLSVCLSVCMSSCLSVCVCIAEQHIGKVAVRWARLVLRWVTVCGQVNHLDI